MCQCGEDSAGSAAGGLHATAYDSDQCQVGFDVNGVGIGQSVDACHYLLFLVHELILMYEYRHGINAGGNMLEGNTIFFKCLQYLSAETDLGVHHIFFNIDGAEALLAGDTGDHVFGLLTGASHDPGTIVLGSVCIADIDRDTFLTYRENGIPDREGEAISWHLYYALKLENKKVYRITFNEITKNAVKESLKNAREIDMNLVDAQQARRMLDRMVGYRISPLLWAKIKRGLSAGRVQSVALRIICDREDEINAFIPEEYWSLDVNLKVKGEKKPICAKYYGTTEKKQGITSKEQADSIMDSLNGAKFEVKERRFPLRLPHCSRKPARY